MPLFILLEQIFSQWDMPLGLCEIRQSLVQNFELHIQRISAEHSVTQGRLGVGYAL